MKENNKKTSEKTRKKIDKQKVRKIFYYTSIFALYLLIMYYKSKSGEENEQVASTSTSVETTVDDEKQCKLEVQFIDVGQADCILVRVDGEAMLIDAGNNEDGKKLVKYFEDLGIKEFEYVVGTHPHEDHIGGMDDIIDNFDIGTFYMPDAVAATTTYEDVLDSLANKNYYLDVPEIGQEFNIGSAVVKVLYVGEQTNNLNESSIVMRMDYDEISYLFTGDATTKSEKAILSSEMDIDVDVLKVGHHGSSTSSSAKFIDACTPEYAIIQVGNENIYNLPKDSIIERLESRDIEIHRTDYEGTIISETDGKVLTLRKERTDTDGN